MSKSLSNVVFQIDPTLKQESKTSSNKTPDNGSVTSSVDDSLSSSPTATTSLDNLWIGAAILDIMAANNSSADQGGSTNRTDAEERRTPPPS